MSLTIIFSIIIIHIVVDFWLQTEYQGLNKSKNNEALFDHVFNYSLIWGIPVIFLAPNNWHTFQYVILSVTFVIITFICHFTTDYITSRITSNRYQKQHFYGINGFWFWISLDQFLHYFQLFLTFKLLTQI